MSSQQAFLLLKKTLGMQKPPRQRINCNTVCGHTCSTFAKKMIRKTSRHFCPVVVPRLNEQENTFLHDMIKACQSLKNDPQAFLISQATLSGLLHFTCSTHNISTLVKSLPHKSTRKEKQHDFLPSLTSVA